jgi:hypothetical protein
MKNLAGEKACQEQKNALKEKMYAKMKEIGDTFEPCSWYEKNWIKDRLILKTASSK